ncbi:30S ribosomal protein S6 [Lignipirellula cremea]|uniref:Small ribosomal subunit protein bS6 n=1 Tax=Lignipirellula cremea TaxID=2528010 RepID=A0A518DLR5_9BACT|nr:30S ribosomal protein S6 [Lignipirellula cremea]QDU92761.1 30S ribosomal protein S6 [Lignipirellula cremea]
MAATVYEGMFILDSNHYARNPSGVSGKIEKMIQDRGGEILASRLWVEQKLAYPIEDHKKGTYWLTYFRMTGEQLKPLNRDCQLNEDVLRQLILKVDQRLVDTLVSHALGESTSTEEPAAEEGAEAAPAAVATEG